MATWSSDFRDFFESLSTHGVQFLIIGGVAYNYHAPPRATKDIDVWVRPARDNLERLIKAIEAFGFPTQRVTIDDLLCRAKVLMLGRVPLRIDVLTQPAGLDWEIAHSRRVTSTYDDVPIDILGLEDLIAAKRAAGRPQDLVDVEVLTKILARGEEAR